MSFRIFPKHHIVQSEISGTLEIIEHFGKKSLYMNSIPQSGPMYRKMWEDSFNRLKIGKLTTCLVLGLGGGTVIKLLKNKYPECRITAVEIDPVIIKIAGEMFDLKPDPGFDITCADAVDWIIHCKPCTFQLIIANLYRNQENPVETRNIQFLTRLKSLLQKHGSILYNARRRIDDPEDFNRFVALCKTVFPHADDLVSYPDHHVIRLWETKQ